MNWEKLCPNVSFTVENKVVSLRTIYGRKNLCKAIRIRIISELVEKICFPWGKSNFELIAEMPRFC